MFWWVLLLHRYCLFQLEFKLVKRFSLHKYCCLIKGGEEIIIERVRKHLGIKIENYKSSDL